MAPTRFLTAPWVLPIATPPVREGAVLVDEDGTILAVGERRDLKRSQGGLEEERAQGALLPALVNAHTHLELSCLEGQVPGGEGLVPWAVSLVGKLSAKSPAEKLASAATAAARARAAGIAAVGDVANALDAVPALASAGLRGVVLHELVGSREARTGGAVADAGREREAYLAGHTWPAGVDYALAPHAPYSAGPDLLRRIFAAGISGPPTSIHIAEDPDELALLADGTGRWPAILESIGVAPQSRTPGLTPVAYLASLGAFAGGRRPLLVHMVHASDADLATAREHRAPVVLCPRSNLHIGGQLPRVAAILKAGLPIALGTDSLASSPSLSLWPEMQLLGQRFPEIDPYAWLAAATAGGARALGREELGVLAPGKRPGVLDVALDAPDAPIESLVSNPTPNIRWMVSA